MRRSRRKASDFLDDLYVSITLTMAVVPVSTGKLSRPPVQLMLPESDRIVGGHPAMVHLATVGFD